MLNVVLVEPEIPANTGNIARSCLAAGARLHLVRPLGFSLDDKYLRRAGMDYWPEVDLTLWDDLPSCLHSRSAGAQLFFLTTKTSRPYFHAAFQSGDFLIFGRETKGLPEALLHSHPQQLLTIPMQRNARSLNLATSVGIVLFEARRQLSQADSLQ